VEFIRFVAAQNKRGYFFSGSVAAEKEVFTFLFNSIHYLFLFQFLEISNPISFYVIGLLFNFVGFVIAKVWNL